MEVIDLPSDLLDHFPNEIGYFLIRRTEFTRVRSELLLDGVEAFVHVVLIGDTGTSSIRSGCGVHDKGERLGLAK